jgi:hypothetical protein
MAFKVGDLVRLCMYPDDGFGIVLSTTSRGVKVYWSDGSIDSIWKVTLEVINENRQLGV